MTDIHAFSPFVVTAADAPAVVSPAYDSARAPEERLQLRQAHSLETTSTCHANDDLMTSPQGQRLTEEEVTAENIEQPSALRTSVLSFAPSSQTRCSYMN